MSYKYLPTYRHRATFLLNYSQHLRPPRSITSIPITFPRLSPKQVNFTTSAFTMSSIPKPVRARILDEMLK